MGFWHSLRRGVASLVLPSDLVIIDRDENYRNFAAKIAVYDIHRWCGEFPIIDDVARWMLKTEDAHLDIFLFREKLRKLYPELSKVSNKDANIGDKDERNKRVIDLTGVTMPSEFMKGWNEAASAYFKEGSEAVNPHNSNTDFDKSLGFACGMAACKHTFGAVREAHKQPETTT